MFKIIMESYYSYDITLSYLYTLYGIFALAVTEEDLHSKSYLSICKDIYLAVSIIDLLRSADVCIG